MPVDPDAHRVLRSPDARDRDALSLSANFAGEFGFLKLLIAIPVFNERKYVEHVLAKVRQFHDQILVIDDGSTDGTGEYLAGRSDIHLIRHADNRGYGQSLIDAFAFADARGFDWVITMDCDEQHEPERIPDFIREIRSDRWDLISGSRYMQQMADNDLPPTDRRSINKFITTTLNDCYGLNLTDAFCGFKAHRMSALRKLKLDIPGYAFPMQLWPQVVHHRLRVIEIPVRLIYNDPTRHFGGMLDDPQNRMRHYLNVLCAEQKRIDASAGEQDRVPCPCGAD
jgi:glycosyltransferase involved in cell wall biosynthesis